MPHVPTYLIFLFPNLICCSYIQKKVSSSFLQLHFKAYLISYPMSMRSLPCFARKQSIKVVILALEYSASSGPPCPSKTLTVQALMELSCEQVRVSQQGLLAQYWSDLTLPLIRFLFKSLTILLELIVLVRSNYYYYFYSPSYKFIGGLGGSISSGLMGVLLLGQMWWLSMELYVWMSGGRGLYVQWCSILLRALGANILSSERDCINYLLIIVKENYLQ